MRWRRKGERKRSLASRRRVIVTIGKVCGGSYGPVPSRISGRGSSGTVEGLLQTGKSKCTEIKSSEKGMSEILNLSDARPMPHSDLDKIPGPKAVDINESCLYVVTVWLNGDSHHLLC
ncbi:hypothetical protein H920_06360 [Fukomys damarensis]|uniref:Uncharacterized protein n=1 Tax=Fukomys damarensis TaxID=885580 RepID=A0A091DMG5_FUKDA|nr:hypothetical protein H920_06360 [Fukomys damarensis]